MSVTTAIENISNHLKNAYDELQGLGADLSNVNKNIENISIVLDNIYDNMPQVSGEGTSLTLDDTKIGKIKSTLKGNTSQSDTPTPASPIPVNVVSGDNEIIICGKNNLSLLNRDKRTRTGASTTNELNNSVTIIGKSTWGNIAYLYTNINKNTTYTINANFISSLERTVGVTIYGTNVFEYVTADLTNLGSFNFLLSANTKTNGSCSFDSGDYQYIVIRFWNNFSSTVLSQSVDLNISEIQLEQGSVATTYESYVSKSYPIHLGIKNLWNNEDMKNGFLPMTGSYPITDQNYPNSRYIIIPLYQGQSLTTYSTKNYGQFRMRYIDMETPDTILGSVGLDANSYYTSTATYQGSWNNGTITAKKNILIGLLDYEGNMSTDGTYQIVYGTEIQNIAATQIELYKIGNYQDYFYKNSDKWYLHKEIEKVILNGNERINSNSGYINNGRFDIMNYANGIKGSASLPGAMSDYFVGAFNLNNGSVFLSGIDSHINVINTSYSGNLAGFKTWLSIHNATIYYILATPIDIEITNTTLIEQLEALRLANSYITQTSIFQKNNDLPFIINATALIENSD